MPANAAIPQANESLQELEGAVRLLQLGTPINWPSLRKAVGKLEKTQNRLLKDSRS